MDWVNDLEKLVTKPEEAFTEMKETPRRRVSEVFRKNKKGGCYHPR
jgi:hypothetical protein